MGFLTSLKSIVNNLTSGGTTKALSAEMGKTLQLNKQDKLPPFNQNGNWNRDINILYSYLQIVGNLNGASLNDGNLSNASLNDGNLSNASLNGAYLNGAYLDNANLNGASLVNATLNGASLYNASLNGANLSNASLNGTNLNSANLDSATGLDADINIALANVNKDPNGDGSSWTLTWTDGNTHQYDPATGLFTLQ